jgi:3-hydroxyisobutyrate dehydrogenase-like beta-hydroxyacid dehydrogenase
VVEMTSVGVLHPGEMGAAVGAAAVATGAEMLWVPEGRSPATAERARAANLEPASLEELLRRCEVVMSVCPPHAAPAVAREVADLGFRGIFVDANAVSPATAIGISETVESGGARYVDGGIIGPPPRKPDRSVLCLSGTEADRVSRLFEGSALGTRVLGDSPDAASAFKMCYAAWTKGTTALLLGVVAADAYGLSRELFKEWDRSQPGLGDQARGAAHQAAEKAWRWVAEMEEIQVTLEAAGLPGGFHAAAAETYARLSAGEQDDPLIRVTHTLTDPPQSPRS